MARIQPAQSARVAGKKGFSLISDGKFRELYALLLQCGMLDERLRSLREYERWPGREAATASVAACLRRGDTVTPTPRGALAGYLQNGTIHLRPGAADEPLGHVAAAAGDALRHKLEKLGHLAVVYTSLCDPGDARESFAVAARLALPVIYIIEGGVPTEESRGAIPMIRVDGADAVAVYRVAYESATRARDGGGPTIIECSAWSLEDAEADPLRKLEQYLTGKKLFRESWKKRLEEHYGRSLDAAMKTVARK